MGYFIVIIETLLERTLMVLPIGEDLIKKNKMVAVPILFGMIIAYSVLRKTM